MILLYTTLLMYGIITMRSVLEEKTTRTMEVLISAVTPVAASRREDSRRGRSGFHAVPDLDGVARRCSDPTAPRWPRWSGQARSCPALHVPASLLLCALVYFFGGYFLYSSMFAAVGAACSNEQDAAQLQWIAMAPLVFTMVIYSLVLNDPTSRASIVLSEIPFFAPVLMPLRVSLQTPPVWQMALSIGLLFSRSARVIYGSAKIYRVGILMYGKRPTLPELVRWLRYS